ncbi:MAG TPA: pseudouridine synthase [Dyella sp.]|uniref:pseudouridine synthase n=1 Tax=Dyella sp. TaxID=1869338 RepID=UPI002C92837E|nr:pseudouridine synthase [Dyella sp.]HTV84454.1 pseudouridine synthase [Dyella sp.]
MATFRTRSHAPARPRFGLARVISKLGVCSRSQAERAVREGRVSVDGRVVLDPECPADAERQRICLDGERVSASRRIYVVLNKPRGIVVTAADERGRDTVYELLATSGLPWLGPVGRLDKASEGLLLLSNDSVWAAGLTDPRRHVDKIYHVQIDAIPEQALLDQLLHGVEEQGEHLSAKRVSVLRRGEKNAWLEIVLDEGRNRQIRRLLKAHGIDVLRLMRIAIGDVALGELGKGQWRHLSDEEVAKLAHAPRSEDAERPASRQETGDAPSGRTQTRMSTQSRHEAPPPRAKRRR